MIRFGVSSLKMRNVAVSFDDNYLFPFLLLAFSISENTSIAPKIFIANVNSTLSQESQNIVSRFCSSLGLKYEIFEASIPKNVRTSSRVSIAGYGRLWLADNLSEDFVYIDTDSLVLPGWELVFDYIELLSQESELLLAAMPALENRTPPWPIEIGDETQYRFHSSILVINSRNWKRHFANQENMAWQKIASMHDELKFVGHDQPVLQYAAQGKYMRLPQEFVNFATKYQQTTKVVTSGVWKKPWTVPRKHYFRYISSLMMYQDYVQVFGVIKELDIYGQYEDKMFDYLEDRPELKLEIQRIKKICLKRFSMRENLPYLMQKMFFELMALPRKLIMKFR
jgi:lipopolysaccharide biosynthesis glycosyltransferase